MQQAKQKEIFQTTNTALAVALCTCGVPFDSDPETGRPLPFSNYYDAETLRKLAYKGSNLTLEEAARDAWQSGRPGTLVYNFLRTDPIDEVLKAFDQHKLTMLRADDQAGKVGMQDLVALPVEPGVAAMICAQFAKNRRILLEGWRTETPWVLYNGEVREEQQGGTTYRVGSMKLHRVGASAETKSKIGL